MSLSWDRTGVLTTGERTRRCTQENIVDIPDSREYKMLPAGKEQQRSLASHPKLREGQETVHVIVPEATFPETGLASKKAGAVSSDVSTRGAQEQFH